MKNAKNLVFAIQIEKTENNSLQKECRKKIFFTFYDKEENYIRISLNLLQRIDSSN